MTKIYTLYIEHSKNSKTYFLKILIEKIKMQRSNNMIIKNANYKHLLKSIRENFTFDEFSNAYKLFVVQLNFRFLFRIKNDRHFINHSTMKIFCRLQFIDIYFCFDTLCKNFLLHKILIVVVKIKYNKLSN